MPKKLRFFLEYSWHYLKTYSLVILLGLITGSLIYAYRKPIVELISKINTPSKITGLEGLYKISNLPPIVANQISYGVTTISEDEKAVLSPIVDKIETSEDSLLYRIQFKDNLVWHNGKKFSTKDLIINIKGATYEYKTDSMLEIKLETPYAPLLATLSQPFFLKDSLIGLGPYKVTKNTFQDGYLKRLKLTPVDSNQDPPLNFVFYQNNSDLINAYKLGEVNEIITSQLDDSIADWPKIKITPKVQTNRYLAIFFNTNKLGDKQFRQALAYATPKTNDKNNRALGPISPNSWAYNPQIKQYNFTPTRAKELAGKEHAKQLKMLVADRQLMDIAESVKSGWRDTLGIELEISFDIRNPNLDDFDAIIAYGSVPTDPDQYTFWHSTQTNTNITKLNNSRIDKLLEEGRLISNPTERKQIYFDFQKFLLEESPVIFLEFPTNYYISRLQ